ncbi:MAG: hypothetical protein H7Y37_18910 [Anaerolineae bacterium]|nr:hypothetical protein [Gloeobacterales cyanobacterium ES-bin-313]
MEFTKTPANAELVAIHPWERTIAQQRLEDLGIRTLVQPDGSLIALLDSGMAGEQQAQQIQAVIFRLRGRRGDMIDWLEQCWMGN